MSADPDKWHIGWEWHANMWYVEPPVSMMDDVDVKWFEDRSEAFQWVDDQIRSQEVISPVEGIPTKGPLIVVDNPILPAYVPAGLRQQRVSDPLPEQVDLPPHIAQYQRMVGLK